MSVILKSPLRLVGTAKYATNNLTQYLRAQEPPNNSFILLTSHSPSDYRSVTFHHTQAKIKSKNFWEWMRVSANKIFTPKLPYKNETSSTILGNFFVKQSSGTIELITNNKRQKNFIFPAVFTAKYNGELIAVESDTIASKEKGPISFRAGGLNLLLDGDKLKFKVKDSDETFILNHAVHITALKKPTQILKGGGIKILPSAHIDDVTAYDAELTLKTPKNEEHRTYKTHCHRTPPEQWDGFGVYGLMHTIGNTKKTAAELYAAAAAAADYPGRVKLQFPMDLSLQGFKHIIKVKETGETFRVCHTVNIKALKESDDKIKNKESKNPKIDVLIQSGDINLHSLDGAYRGLHLRYEVSIKLNDNEICITPITKQKFDVEKHFINI